MGNLPKIKYPSLKFSIHFTIDSRFPQNDFTLSTWFNFNNDATAHEVILDLNGAARTVSYAITKENISNEKVTLHTKDDNEIPASRQQTLTRLINGTEHTTILAFLDRASLLSAVPDNGKTELEVTGRLTTEQIFYDTDTIRIIKPKNKPQWKKTEAIDITLYMGKKPEFIPKVQAKLLYDDDYVYAIFRTDDSYVRAVETNNQGSVCRDSCVEFFFTPNLDISTGYFNLETNCIGTALLNYQLIPWQNIIKLEEAEIKQMNIAHSMPKKVIDPEITTPTTWYIEYRLPVEILSRYNKKVEKPAPGVKWRANFYKCADETSKPHWITWSYIDKENPDFHVPQDFGTLEFTD